MPERGQATAERWAWLEAADEEEQLAIPQAEDVLAVMVVHNAAQWLPRQLVSLARLDPRPGRLVAVDVASGDESRAQLTQAATEGVIDAVVHLGQADSFAEAVVAGIGRAQPGWLWLLHDDSAPVPTALADLLRGAGKTQADVLIPALLQPPRRNYPDTIAEAGETITRNGHRVRLVEPGDIDQGHLASTAVLGGSTAGMLIRRETWQALDGLSPEVPLHRDGLDFCWRANAAGYSVRTWPEARLVHREASRFGEREGSLGSYHEVDRLAALRVVGARGRGPVGLIARSWLRAFGFLVAKSPSTAAAELRAARRFAATGKVTAALRARLGPPDDGLDHLRPRRGWPVRHALDRLGAGIADRYREATGTEPSLDELTGDDFADAGTRARRRVPVAELVVLLLLVAGVAAGRTLAGGVPVGGGLLPAPADLASAWAAVVTPLPGTSGANAPWLAFAALGSVLSFGQPMWLSVAVLCLGPAAAGLAALTLLRRLDVSPALAAMGAGTWGGGVILLGAVTAGDGSAVVLAGTLPLLIRALVQVAESDAVGAERLRAPVKAGFWLLLATLAWPAMFLLALLVCVILGVRRVIQWWDLGWMFALALAFIAPWLPTLWRWPGRVLTGADPLAWPDYSPASVGLFAGRILPSGLPLWANLAFFGVLGLAALLGIIAMANQRHRLLALAVIAVPLLLGFISSRLVVAVLGGQARPLQSGWALLVIAGLLAPVVLLGRARRVAVVVLAVTAALAAGVWAVVGFAGPVEPTASRVPGYVTDVVNSPRATRVLLIQRHEDGLVWNVVDRSQPSWGTGERQVVGDFADDYASLVQSLSGEAPDDLAARLAELGTSHVYLEGFTADQLAAIGNAAGLTSATAGDDAVVWTVVGVVSRYRIQDGSEPGYIADGTVAAANHERTLIIAEPPDDRWQVRIGDTELSAADDPDSVSFTVPAGVGGELQVERGRLWGPLIWQIVIGIAMIGLAAPSFSPQGTARRGIDV
ncbi:MAG: glycosyltransferase [Arachnia sp.]